MSAARRSNFQEGKLSYAEVGASQVHDLMQFPPNGATPFSLAARLGSGPERFTAAVSKLMTWQAFTEAGFAVSETTAGPAAADPNREVVYGADGTPFLQAGAQASITGDKIGARRFTVVRVMTGNAQAGVVLGTADAGEFTGEVSFAIEHLADGTVQAGARGFFHDHGKRFLGIGQGAAETAVAAVTQVLAVLSPTAQIITIAESDGQPGIIADPHPANSDQNLRAEADAHPAVAADYEDSEQAGS